MIAGWLSSPQLVDVMGLVVEDSSKPQPQKKRGPIVPIEPGAPKQPNVQQHKDDLAQIRKQIDDLFDKIKESKEKHEGDKGKDTVREQLIADQRMLIDKKKNATQQITKKREALQRTFKIVNEARKQVSAGERECRMAAKQAGAFDVSEADIDKQIAELEFRLESGGVGTVKGEKKVIQQIKDLNAKKAAAKEAGASIDAKLTAAEGKRDEADKAAAHAVQLQAEMDLLRAEVKELLDQISKKSEELDAHSANSELKKSREERDKWGEEISKKKELMKKKNEEHDKQWTVYKEWKVEYDKKVKQALADRAKEREEENKRRDAERREKELLLQSIRRMNPYEAEINAAETLIGYLMGKVALTAKPEAKVERKVADFDATQGGKFKVMKKEEDSFTVSKKKKNDAAKFVTKAAPAKPAEPKEPKVVARKPLKHSSEKYAAFEKLGVTMPQFTDEVKPVIEELKKKKAEWESHKKTEKEAMAEEQAEQIARRKKQEAAEAEAEE